MKSKKNSNNSDGLDMDPYLDLSPMTKIGAYGTTGQSSDAASWDVEGQPPQFVQGLEPVAVCYHGPPGANGPVTQKGQIHREMEYHVTRHWT